MADVDKVKTRLGLRKAQREVFQVRFAVQTSVATHGLTKAGQVGVDSSNNLNVAGMIAALLEDSGPQGVRSLLTALDTLPDEGFLKLERISHVNCDRSAVWEGKE